MSRISRWFRRPQWAALSALRVRFTVIAAAGAAIVLTVGALLLYDGLISALEDAVTAELRVRANDVAVDLRSGSPLGLGAGLPTQVVTPGGRVIARAGDPPPIPRSQIAEALRREIVVDGEGVAGPDSRLLARRARLDDGRLVVVAVTGSTAPIEAASRRLAVVLGIAGPAMVIAVALSSWVLTGGALRPVRRMTRRAATISLREPDDRLPQPPGRDEIAELGQTLNAMLDRIAETVAHERRFIDDASHELRTPLAVLRGELELTRLELLEGNDPDRNLAAVDSALEETDRLILMTEQLLVLARADAGHLADQREPVRLQESAERVLSRLDAGDVDTVITGDDLIVVAAPAAIDQLLTNLLANGIRWAESRVLVETGRSDGTARLTVADDGPGFDARVLERPFERFRRGDAARTRGGGGTGLGLSIVEAITTALGGEAELGNGAPLGGARVVVRLPRDAEGPAAEG